MNKTVKKILELTCGLSLLLAVMGCEDKEGSPNFAFIIPMLCTCTVSGSILKITEKKK